MAHFLIPLPDVRKLDRAPSWPAWLELRVRSIKDVCQRSQINERYQTLPTLRRDLTLTGEERDAIELHVSELQKLLAQTPAASDFWKRATLVKIAEVLMAPFRGPRLNAQEAEIAGKHYLIALDVIPSWAVDIAIENWLCCACGTNERGSPHDYDWRPTPATLRRVALLEQSKLAVQVARLGRLLSAEPLIEFDEAHCAMMRAKLADLAGIRRS